MHCFYWYDCTVFIFLYQAHLAAEVADKYCDGEVRLTVDQKFLFPNVDTAKIPEMLEMEFFEKFPVVRLELQLYTNTTNMMNVVVVVCT